MNSDSFQAPTLEELSPLFPAYDINAFIAQGGMGAVYLGTQKTLDRSVAIKILPRHLGADLEFRKSFQAEAKAMAKLNHPNLIGVYDFGEVDGMPFIVMEYVAGKSLHDSCYGKQIDPAEAGRIVAATLRGLHHAHENDILHRDVKPANILLDPRANPKLGDFGLAMAGSGESDGLVYGTPGFAAPEVYAGHPDHRSDTYAAAVTLYLLLTGEMPGEPYQHPSQLCGCSSRFDRLLATALQPDPDDRHADAEAFASEIEAVLSQPASAFSATSPATVAPAAPLSSSKDSSTPFILTTIAALVAVGGGAFFLLRGSDESADAIAEKPATEAPAEVPEEKLIAEEPTTDDVEDEEGAAQELAKKDPPKKKKPNKPKNRPKPKKEAPVAQKKPEVVIPESTFDHSAFLARGRAYCRREAQFVLNPYEKDLVKNITNLERELRKIVRDGYYLSREAERLRRDAMEATLQEYEAEGRLPDNLLANPPATLIEVAGENTQLAVRELLIEAMAAQVLLDNQVKEELSPLRKVYLEGVQKQVTILHEEKNATDAAILKHEIETAEKSPSYFREILEGAEPQPLLPEELVAKQNSQLLAGGIHGDWYRASVTPAWTIRFRRNGRVNLNPGGITGTWRKLSSNQYEIIWPNGTSSQVAPSAGGLLEVNQGEYFLSRQPLPVVGSWQHKGEDTVWNFQPTGYVTSSSHELVGKWDAGEDKVVVTWAPDRTAEVTFAPSQPNEFKALLQKSPQTLDFTRLKPETAFTEDFTATPRGRWVDLNKEDRPVFTFFRNGSAQNRSWLHRGTWGKEPNGHYYADWGAGARFSLKMKDRNTLLFITGNAGTFQLTRQ